MSRHLKDCWCSMNLDSPNKHCENSKRPLYGRIPSCNNIICRQRRSVLKVLADFIRLLWVYDLVILNVSSTKTAVELHIKKLSPN